MSDTIDYRQFPAAPDAWRETVFSFLREFNKASNPEYWSLRELPENERKPLEIIAAGPGDSILGGIFGSTQFKWLKIDVLAVREDCRGRGIGRELMRRAEAEAVKRGCSRVYVDTMDIQAPEFYTRLGFCEVGRLEDWDSHGHAKLLLVKEL